MTPTEPAATKAAYRPREAARLLDVDPKTLRRAIRDGTVRAVRIAAHTWRIPAAEIERILGALPAKGV